MTKQEKSEECRRIMDKEYGGYPDNHQQRWEIERQINGYETAKEKSHETN
jgi:hypothetical protein